MAKGNYPHYEWVSDLKKGLEAHLTLTNNPQAQNKELQLAIEKGEEAYRELTRIRDNATRNIIQILTNPEFQKFKDTSVYSSYTYNASEILKLLNNAHQLSGQSNNSQD